MAGTGESPPVDRYGPAFADYVTQLQAAWKQDRIPDRAEACRQAMERLLNHADPAWLGAMEAVVASERKVELYRDPGAGFIQMVHPYRPGHASPPHGHGPGGWVVYGVQRGRVEIATYDESGGDPPLAVAGSEVLGAGEARAYLPGEMHSTRMVEGEGPAGAAVVLRLLSEDLSRLERRRFAWSDVSVAG